MATQVRTIRVINKVDGAAEIKKLSRQYGQLNKGIKRSADSLGLFKKAFQLGIAGVGIREIVRVADRFQLLRDRIKVFTGSQREATEAFQDIARAAKFTRTSISSLAEVYNRVALSTKELGLSSKQIIAFSAGLQQTFRLTGATIAEASAATIQLTQGLASGQLRGQELRSVLEQNATVGQILADTLDTTRGKLLKFAESGKITSQVVLKALAENIDKINEDAKNLGTTFEQSTIIILDAFGLKIDELNRKLGLNKAFEKFALSIVDNVEIIGFALAALGTGFLTMKVVAITSLTAIKGALISTGIGALIVGLGILIGKLATDWDRSILQMERIWVGFVRSVAKGADKVSGFILGIINKLRKFQGKGAIKFELFDAATESIISNTTKRISELDKEILKLTKSRSGGDLSGDISKLLKSINTQGKTAELTLAQLNKQYISGAISATAYREAVSDFRLDELNKKFEEGKIDLDQYNNGLISLGENLSGIEALSLGAEQGLRNVAKTAGNVAQQISQGFTNAFKTLENSILDFIKTGEFNFAKFTQAILDDLARIIIRASIIAPLAQGILNIGAGAGAASGGGGSVGQLPSAGTFANGGVFGPGGVTAFANGGVVNGPTVFPFANGIGLMGEAGPEAIMPLTRRNGKLGVAGSGTVVNIINQSGGEVEQQEKQGPNGEKILDIIIKQKVKDALSSGALDKQLGDTFGLRRRGN